MKLNLITLGVVLMAVVLLVLHAGSVEWTAVKVLGAAIAGVSLVMLIVARLQLGASFSVSAQARKLVTTGLYAKIRNPIYVFGVLIFVGLVMVTEKWALLALIVVLVPMQIVRARKEEQVLAEAFGEEYARYKAGTWF
jgi:protein-S-isoprenylcysteine O-methyltransferase Ste14